MVYTCKKCGERLILWKITNDHRAVITSFTVGWCTNKDCEHYGVLTVRGDKEKEGSE